tara:strand:+ start:26 stop:289 length:264 start_codon:yes stop_codon:yes gene_type:complete
MEKKLFVGGIAWATTEEQLREVFGEHGEIKDLIIIKDRETGRSKGYGFVTMADEESGKNAMEQINGKEIDGRTLRVDEATERKPKRF